MTRRKYWHIQAVNNGVVKIRGGVPGGANVVFVRDFIRPALCPRARRPCSGQYDMPPHDRAGPRRSRTVIAAYRSWTTGRSENGTPSADRRRANHGCGAFRAARIPIRLLPQRTLLNAKDSGGYFCMDRGGQGDRVGRWRRTRWLTSAGNLPVPRKRVSGTAEQPSPVLHSPHLTRPRFPTIVPDSRANSPPGSRGIRKISAGCLFSAQRTLLNAKDSGGDFRISALT